MAADLQRRSRRDEDSTDEVVDDEDGAAAAPSGEFAVPDTAALASATWEEGGSRGVAAAGRGGPDSLRDEDAMAAVKLFFWEGGLFTVW